MFDDTQIVLHRQPTISNRSPLDTRSRRSDAEEAVQDTRPPSTDNLTGRPIRQTVQTSWKTLDHTARLQNTGRRASTTLPLRPDVEPRSTDCWGRTTAGSTTSTTGPPTDNVADVSRSTSSCKLSSLSTDLSRPSSLDCPRLTFQWARARYLNEDRWPSCLSGLQTTAIQVRRRALRTSDHVTHIQSLWRRRVSRCLRCVRCRAGFNWWEAWGPVYLGGTGRLQQLYD